MAVVIDATVGGALSNSFETHAEANVFFEERLPLSPPWVASGQELLLVMSTRILSMLAQPIKILVPAQGGVPAYYRVGRQWTGQPATTTQRLPWPRTGMFDQNGNAIAANVIPQQLKDAESELAGQLKKKDLTLDNSVIVQGLKSLKAGPVAMSFKDNIVPHVIPDAIFGLLVQSWLTDELYEPALQAQFDVVSPGFRDWIVE